MTEAKTEPAKKTLSGSCQCGTVTFDISGTFDCFFLCHCSRCRKATGSAHGANLFSSTAKGVWKSGADNIKTYQIPGTRNQKNFCMTCGSAVPIIADDGNVIVVPAGSLDNDVDIKPTAHICCESRANWDQDLETIPSLDGLPG